MYLYIYISIDFPLAALITWRFHCERLEVRCSVALAVPVSLPSTSEDTLLPGTVKSEDVESKTPTSASLNTRRCNSLTYDDAHACSPDTHTYKYIHIYIVCVFVYAYVCVRACVRACVHCNRERDAGARRHHTQPHTCSHTLSDPTLHPTPTTTTTLPRAD